MCSILKKQGYGEGIEIEHKLFDSIYFGETPCKFINANKFTRYFNKLILTFIFTMETYKHQIKARGVCVFQKVH